MKQKTSQFNFTYRYIDDVLPINNQYFENSLIQMLPFRPESNTSPSYFDLFHSIGRDGQLRFNL